MLRRNYGTALAHEGSMTRAQAPGCERLQCHDIVLVSPLPPPAALPLSFSPPSVTQNDGTLIFINL